MKSPHTLLAAAAMTALTLSAHAQVVVTPSEGFTIAWDGNDGDGFVPEDPAPVPANLANATGSEAFTSSDLGPILSIPFHVVANLNDGLYGNANSWIGGDAPDAYAAIRLPGLATITSFAFGRDNGNSVTDACGGQCADRSLGLYTIQITRVTAPDESTLDTGDATTGWLTIGTLEYTGSEDSVPGEGFTSYFRHEYEVAQGATPIQATGFRILVPATGLGGGTAIDEIELYGPDVVDPDRDGDGFDDVVEIEVGTDPDDRASTPESITELVTAVEFKFWAARNIRYFIEQSPDLVAWTTIEENIPGRGGQITRLYSITGQPKQHYRSGRQP